MKGIKQSSYLVDEGNKIRERARSNWKKSQTIKNSPKQGMGDFRLLEEKSGLYTAPTSKQTIKSKSNNLGMGDFRQLDEKLYKSQLPSIQRRQWLDNMKKKHPIAYNTVGQLYEGIDALGRTKVGRAFNSLMDKAVSSAGANDDLMPQQTGNKTVDKVNDFIAPIVGSIAVPGENSAVGALDDITRAGLSKIAPKLGKIGAKVATNKIVQAALGAGNAAGIVNASHTAVNGGNIKDVGKSYGEGMALGGALGGGLTAAGKGISKVADHLNAGKNFKAWTDVNEAYSNAKVEPGKVSELKLKTTSSPLGGKNTSIRETAASLEHTPSVLNERTSTPTASIKVNSPDPTGENYALGPKERSFAKSVIDSQVATGDIKTNLKDNKLTYEPITNKETFDKATNTVSQNPDRALEYFNSPSSKGVSADDVALGEALITKAIKDGNSREANRLITDLAEKLTTAGQAVQAASIFKRLTPEGMLMYAQRIVNTANKEALHNLGKKAKKILITSDDTDFILKTMKHVQELPEGRNKDVELAKVMQRIANKVPATNSEKAKAIQRIVLLLNPKTMVRNVLGNTIFGAVDNLSNAVATPLDIITSKFTGKRTTTLPSLTGQLKSGVQGIKETVEDARLGIDTSPGRTQYELPNKRIFETKSLNALDKATKVGLQLGDRPFYKAAFDDVLRQQMKLAKVKEPTMDMIEQAHKIAEQRTYQDVNSLTKSFKMIQNALNFNKSVGIGNIVLPFVKTPANILRRAIEYSPIGIQKAFSEAMKIGRGTFDQKTFVDSIARSVTGTALIMVGYDLAKKDIITGSGDKDKDIAAFERNLGKSDFAFKVNGKYYTYDWAQPASMALAIGADMYLNGKDRKHAENVISDAIKSGGQTLFKQSLLQGLQRFMGGFTPMENIETTLINAPNMLVPTLGKQIAQELDPTQRSTYSQTKGGTALNMIKAKTPGLSKSLQPKVDTFGNVMKNYQGNNSLFNIFLNPGTSTSYKPNQVQKEIMRVYKATGDNNVFPKVAPKYFTYKGQRIDMTPTEITAFQKSIGKKTEQRMSKVINQKMPDENKAKLLKRMIENSYDEAKLELIKRKFKKQGN